MSNLKKIDIVKVRKGPIVARPKTSPTQPPKPIHPHRESVANQPVRMSRHSSGKLRYLALIKASWGAVFSADIFELAFIRNILSLKVISIAALPIISFQVKYLATLRPDEILSYLKSVVDPQNAFQIVVAMGVLGLIVIVSGLADTLISPAIIRFRFQQLDSRKPKIGKSLKQSAGLVFSIVGQKIIKSMAFVLFVVIVFGTFYVAYVLSYGSVSLGLILYGVSAVVALVLLTLYNSFKFWLLVGVAVGGKDGPNKTTLALKQVFFHPLANLGYGLNSLISFLAVLFFSLLLVGLNIYILSSDLSGLILFLLLSLTTTSLYILWTIWTAWQAGYWSKLAQAKSNMLGLVLSQEEELKYWRYLGVIVIALAIIAAYLILAYLYSDQIIQSLTSLYNKLPSSFQLSLPKPQ